jgi:hypothetical protein
MQRSYLRKSLENQQIQSPLQIVFCHVARLEFRNIRISLDV